MKDFSLSDHFTFHELTNTSHRHLLAANRAAGMEHVRPLKILCESLLEEVRDEFGAVVVLSGFRAPALNAAVGGSPHSQHMRGEAADFFVPDASLPKVFAWLKNSGLVFHQLIYYPDRHFIHVSLPTGRDDGQVMINDGG